MIVYGADLSGPSNKVRFVANYLKLDYEYRRVSLRHGENRRPEFFKLHPAGKIPVIDDGGFVLFESNAIIRYLNEKTKGSLYPEAAQSRALVDQWLDFVSIHVGEGIHPVVFNRIFAPILKADIDEKMVQMGHQLLQRFLPILDEQLRQQPYLSGPGLSLADMALLATLDPAEAAAIDLGAFPHVSEWRKKLRQEEFYTRCHTSYEEQLKKFI